MAIGIYLPVRSSVLVTGSGLACEIVEIRPSGCVRHEKERSAEMANQTWQFREFPAPDGEQAAVDFLNEPLRQGRGEASATPRNDGTAGLLWLEPGSLGESTAQTWQYKEFPGPDGEQAALAFLNASPRQGAGEASGFVRNDGSAVIFYLEPGSG